MMRIVMWITAAVLAAPAAAETQYVTERLAVPLYIGPSEGPVLRSIEAGTALEVLERRERFARVRDRTGEAWIDARYLGAEPPARAQLARSAEEVNKLKKDLAETQARLRKAEGADTGGAAALAAKNAELARSAEEINKLRKELAAAQVAALSAAQNQVQSPAAAAEKPAGAAGEKTAGGDKPAEEPSAATADDSNTVLWLGVSFAMLVTGFFAGQYWLRENIRRRSGGMYIRV
jgi:SH3 domain protein